MATTTALSLSICAPTFVSGTARVGGGSVTAARCARARGGDDVVRLAAAIGQPVWLGGVFGCERVRGATPSARIRTVVWTRQPLPSATCAPTPSTTSTATNVTATTGPDPDATGRALRAH